MIFVPVRACLPVGAVSGYPDSLKRDKQGQVSVLRMPAAVSDLKIKMPQAPRVFCDGFLSERSISVIGFSGSNPGLATNPWSNPPLCWFLEHKMTELTTGPGSFISTSW